MRSGSRLAALLGSALVFSAPAMAVPTSPVTIDTFNCDVLSIPNPVEEIGNAPGFVGPSDVITSAPLGSSPTHSACPTNIDSPFVPNQRVSITNTTGVAYLALWYVTDPETYNSAYDGTVNGSPAFRIDNVGLNQPLISESLVADLIFDVGETWVFSLQDWTSNVGGSPAGFGGVGVGTLSLDGAASTGSILGIPVPEPGTGLLLFAGLVGLSRRRRVRA